MKNYLVKSLFRVASTNWHVLQRAHEPDLYQHYREMHQISSESFGLKLDGTWEMRFVEGEVDNINQAFERTFWYIHDLWHSEPCNILYTDPDTLAIRPLKIFGEYDCFAMFNYTDPRVFGTQNRYDRRFDNFFNAGVRYFPHTMDRKIWELGAHMAREWDYDTYDTEQIILNAMLWDQGVTVDSVLHPELNWIAMNLRQNDPHRISWHETWNRLPMGQAKVLHFASSRGAESTKLAMQKFAREFN